MTFSSRCLDRALFILLLEITIVITSQLTVDAFGARSLYLHLRAQDAPHALGGTLADQFSWYVLNKNLNTLYF